MARWTPHRIYEFPQWLRNDTMKYRRKPGMQGAVERAELAADLLDAVIAVHAACQTAACPTRQAIERVLAGEQ